MEERSVKFGLVLTEGEREALHCLAERERISASAVVRRLVWREAVRLGIVDGGRGGAGQGVRDGQQAQA